MILIHTALLCEAQNIIEQYKLKKTNSKPKIYSNETLVVLIGGIGKESTFTSLSYVFNQYSFTKAINIGIAGCSDNTVAIGSLYSCLNQLNDIKYKEVQTVDTAQLNSENKSLLYDMEAKYFLEITQKHLDQKKIEIIKIVSDHLDDTKLDKDFVKQLVYKNYKELFKIINNY